MRDTFDVGDLMLEQVAQSLLEFKKMGRSLESGADALVPLAANEEVEKVLVEISSAGAHAAKCASDLYNRVAKAAAKR